MHLVLDCAFKNSEFYLEPDTGEPDRFFDLAACVDLAPRYDIAPATWITFLALAGRNPGCCIGYAGAPSAALM